MITGHTGCGGVRAAMIAAVDESTHGSPIPAQNESDKIISNWIAPVSLLPPFSILFTLSELTPFL